LKSSHILKFWKKKLDAGWGFVGRTFGQPKGSRLKFVVGYGMCVMHTIATPVTTKKMHHKKTMLTFAATTTMLRVHG
jgi:hypothetical protein